MKTKSKKLDSILEEAFSDGASIFGGAKGGGGGTFSYSQTAGAKTWSPGSPAFRHSTSDPQGYNVKDMGDEEHMLSKRAGKILPYPLETIMEQIVNAWISINNAETQLRLCMKFNSVITDKKEKKALLKDLHKRSIVLKGILKKVAEDIDHLSLS